MSRIVYLTAQPRGATFKLRDDHVLITPNARAAHSLAAPALSLDELAKRFAAARRPTASSSLARRLLRDAVGFVRDATAQGRELASTVDELLRLGIQPGALKTSASPAVLQLADIQARYLELLTETGVWDDAQTTWAALEAVSKREKVLVTGYPRIGTADVHFLDAVAAEGSALVLPYHPVNLFVDNKKAAEWLEERGWVVHLGQEVAATIGERVSTRFASEGGVAPPPESWAYQDQESEVRAVLGRVKALLQADAAAEEIALVVRSERTYGPLIAAIAAEYDLPLQIGYPVPLTNTRVGAWLQLLAHVIHANFPFEGTARLLKHPLTARLTGDAWTEARKTHPRGIRAWVEADIGLSTLKWPGTGSRSAYRGHLEAALTDLGVSAALERAPRDRTALARFWAELKDSPADEVVTRDAFLGELGDLLKEVTLPFGYGNGVGLFTPLGVFGGRYKHVFVLGLAEGALPMALRDSGPLDFFERRDLVQRGVAIETAVDKARRERLSVWALLQTATASLALSYPQQLEGQQQLASPVFAELGCPARPAKSPYAASAEEARQARLSNGDNNGDPVLTRAHLALVAELGREGHAAPDHFDGVTGVPLDPAAHTFSATQLLRLGQCPFRWYAQHVLKLRELKEAEDDLSPALKGKLYHKVLELAALEAMARDGRREGLVTALEASFVAAEEAVELPVLSTWTARRDEHLRVLQRAVEDASFLPEGHTIIALERTFTVEWEGLIIEGVIDRIDETPQGLVVTDYKTRGSPLKGAKDASGKTTVDVQLPLYLHAVKEGLFPGDAVAGGLYFSLTKREQRVIGRFSDKPESAAALSELARHVHTSLGSGSFPVSPDQAGHACASCDFDLMCRKGPRLERKRSGHAD